MRDKIIIEISKCEWESTGCPCDPKILRDVEILEVGESICSDEYTFIVETNSANSDIKEVEKSASTNKQSDVIVCSVCGNKMDKLASSGKYVCVSCNHDANNSTHL